MIKIKARKFLEHTLDELWSGLQGDMILVFPDGEVQTNEREVIYSRYFWEYHRQFPNTPLLKEHFVQSFLKNGELFAGTDLKMVNKILFDVYDAYTAHHPDHEQLIDDLSRLGYQIINTAYNDLSKRLGGFVTSLDIVDFIQVTKDPEIENKISDNPPTEEGIDAVTKMLQGELANNPKFKNNPLAVSIRTGIARMGQAMQCLGWRGFLTDVDSYVFPEPISTGYVRGIRTLHDSMIESRSAAKSLMNATKPLQDSEFFSRRQQLICQNVKNLHFTDCGSTNYMLWHIRDVQHEGVTQVLNGDLNTLEGKYYLDEESNTLKVLKRSDRHLIGKTLKLRSLVAGCEHPDPYGVCKICYGETGLAIPKNTNLGHTACVTMTSILGQLILSTKHFDGSSKVEGIVLKPAEKKYLSAELNGSRYFLSDKLKNKTLKLYVMMQSATGLADIKLVDDVRKLSVTRVSEFDMVQLLVTTAAGVGEINSLSVCVGKRRSSMTHELLAHIKKTGFTITADGKYEFDMTGWDFNDPLFILPMRHFNMSDHQLEIAKMLEATAQEMTERSSHISPTTLLMEFHDLVNRRLQVNLSVLEVILYSSMVVDAVEGNYDLPKPWSKGGMGVMRLLLRNRSKSAAMAFQNHREVFYDPASYIQTNVMDHVFDPVFLPVEYFGKNK